jgi:hypothetical protein
LLLLLISATQTTPTSPTGQHFLLAWFAGVFLLVILYGWLTVWPVHRAKVASIQRHLARLNPEAADPGTTAPDFSLPAEASPTKVSVGIYVDRIVELSVKESTWTADFYVWFRWTGNDLNPGEEFQIVDGAIESKEREVEHTAGDDHYELYRVIAKITKAFDVARFPCDDHQLLIQIENPRHPREQLLFVADQDNSSVSSRVKVTAYDIKDTRIIEKPHSYKTTRGDPRLPAGAKSTYSQCRLAIGLRRAGWGYYFKMFQSLYVAVFIAMLVMFVKPTNVDPRFGLGVGGLFAAVANSYVTASLIPDTGVMTVADLVNGLGIATILITVIQSTISLYLFERKGAESLSRRFDQLSFAAFFAGYILLNLALPIAASA